MGSFFRSLLNYLTMPLRALIAAPGQLLSGSKRLAKISLPARVAIAAFLFLLICVSITLIIFIFYSERAFVWAKLTPTFFMIVTVLVILIPLVLYKVLQLWLEGEVGEFPDIEKAWEDGLAELQRHSLDIHKIPLFLVLGTSGTAQEKTLFDTAKLDLSFRDFPQGPAALHWFASPEAVYVVLSGVGSLTSLARLSADSETIERAQPLAVSQPAAAPILPHGAFAGQKATATIQFDPMARVAGPQNLGASLEQNLGLAPEAASAALPPRAGGQGTMMIDEPMRAALAVAAVNRGAQGQRKAVAIDEEQAAEQERRIEFLGRLIRTARQPVCPINGILTLLPFWLIERGDAEAKQLQRVVKRDLAALAVCLRIRCAVTALVVGLEEESGFRELVRRVGKERAVNNRVGKSLELWNQPRGDTLAAVAEHACGLVEGWIYTLFSARGGLNKPGNAKLYMLLCKLRLIVLRRLKPILAEGYGFDPARERGDNGLFFGGCYFAGLGDSDERQAFVKSVLDKLPEQQGYLAWTPAALAEEDRYQLLGQFVLVVDTLLLLGIVAAFAYRFWWSK